MVELIRAELATAKGERVVAGARKMRAQDGSRAGADDGRGTAGALAK
jgi:hypothetical protein